jgi:Ni,Fe-hydrogenase I cytochrome b subunit
MYIPPFRSPSSVGDLTLLKFYPFSRTIHIKAVRTLFLSEAPRIYYLILGTRTDRLRESEPKCAIAWMAPEGQAMGRGHPPAQNPGFAIERSTSDTP